MGSIASSREIEREKKETKPPTTMYISTKKILPRERERDRANHYTSTKNLFYREKRSENKP